MPDTARPLAEGRLRLFVPPILGAIMLVPIAMLDASPGSNYLLGYFGYGTPIATFNMVCVLVTLSRRRDRVGVALASLGLVFMALPCFMDILLFSLCGAF